MSSSMSNVKSTLPLPTYQSMAMLVLLLHYIAMLKVDEDELEASGSELTMTSGLDSREGCQVLFHEGDWDGD